MRIDDKTLLEFLAPQLRDFGGRVEIEPDHWALFAVGAADEPANNLASWLLAGARFTYHSGPSEDDQWTIYYVETPVRDDAVHWMDEMVKVTSGRIRPTSPAQRRLIRDIARSGLPHRMAQTLAEQHERGELSAGCVQDPRVICTLLDRLQSREPIFLTALLTLLNHHLIDLIVLLRQLVAEDLSLEDEMGRAAMSRDPFQSVGQRAAIEIRAILRRFHIINPLDPGTNTLITNPYSAYMEVASEGGQILASIAGHSVALPQATLIDAIHSTRRNLYLGIGFGNLDTQAPWMRDEIANSFRYIKQRLDGSRDLSPMDGLYMLERAVEGPAPSP